MAEQFIRTAMLFGKDKVEKLRNRRVAVFGLGGVGGHCAEALCRSGIGALDLFDGDVVDISNINRQIIATHKTIGLDKVSVMEERLLDINPELLVKSQKIFYLPDNADDVDLSVFDYIVDAVDTVSAKLEIIYRADSLGIPIISAMGAGNKVDPTAFEVADIYETSVCPLARVMRGELRKRGIDKLKVVYSKEKPYIPISEVWFDEKNEQEEQKRRSVPASNAFVPPVAGLIMASVVVMDLLES
ncbi:MAG: tRNA threonylcarbamoyladenosine dehydratase [Oscillospiraceae bacterium]|nr:tRNA threonylcarbamoyladenosine dehydratase [Oscillospiraceae bacterium]